MKIIFLMSFVLIGFLGKDLQINHNPNSVKEIVKHSLMKSNSNITPTLTVDDYYYDYESQDISDFNDIMGELIDTSIDNNIYFSEEDLNPNLEIVPCNYSTFKTHVYNTNNSYSQIYNTLKNTPRYDPISITPSPNSTENDPSMPYVITPDINIEQDTNVGGGYTLTIFTAGIGGYANDWSNNGTRNSNYENSFYLNEKSLPYKISQKFDSKIYIANPKNVANISSSTPTNDRCLFYNIDCGKNQMCNFNTSTANTGQTTLEFENNSVIIFNFKDNQYSHEVVYQRFKNMVGSIKQNCPSVTFNLIGHSRGGLINSMYAAEEPAYVNKIYSIGTPYYENDLATTQLALDKIASFTRWGWLSELTENFGGSSDAYTDIANPAKAKQIRQNINSVMNNSSNDIKLTTIGFCMNMMKPAYALLSDYYLRVDMEFKIYTDIFVDTFKQIGVNSDMTPKVLFGSTVLYEIIEAATSDTPLSGHNTEIIEIRGYEMLNEQKEYWDSNNNNDEFTQFGTAVAIPHNLETMNVKFHNIVLEDI